jgi:TonB family protein
MKLSIITFLSILFFIATANLGFSQNKKNSLDTVFYSNQVGEINLRSEADYYKVTEKVKKNWEVREYYMNDILKYKRTYSDKKLSKSKGSVYVYDENGTLREEYNSISQNNETEYVQVYSKEGKPLLIDGNAFVMSDDEKEGKLYRDYKVVERYVVNEEGKKIYLSTAGESAFDMESIEPFYKHVGSTMNYPLEAKRLGIQGRVFVQFIVDEEGKTQDVKILKGIGGGCDAESQRVVESYQNWKVSTNHKGEKIAMRVTIPLVFKLN